MRMRKLFAGIAAAATLLGGAALGAAGAQAAQATGITINNAQAGHTYTSYKFADVRLDATTNPESVEVTTVAGWNDALKTALSWNTLAQDVRTLYDANPAAYAATLDANSKAFRDFAANLAAVGDAAGSKMADGTGAVKLPVAGDGWYLVTDAVAMQDGSIVFGTQAIVATTVDGMTGTFPVKGDLSTGQGNITAAGEFNAKNGNVPDTPDKTVKKGDASVDGGSVNVGDELTYTIAAKIPDGAAGYDAYHFVISDEASKGLQMPNNKDGYTITIGGRSVADLFEVTQTGDAEHGTVTTFSTNAETARRIPGYAGKTVTITYTATVTKDAIDCGFVNNKASVTTKDGTSGFGETVSYTYDFAFTKIDAQGNALAGAQFSLTDADGTMVRTATTGADGAVSWTGLAAGTYTVTETKAPAGYSSSFLPTFKVTITQNADKSATVTIEGDIFGLVSQNKDTRAIRVKNVKNAAQLPLTGAAGAALFTVVALLVAGVGATVVLKARSRSAMV